MRTHLTGEDTYLGTYLDCTFEVALIRSIADDQCGWFARDLDASHCQNKFDRHSVAEIHWTAETIASPRQFIRGTERL